MTHLRARKLTDQQRDEMVELYRSSGLSVIEIADRFGVSDASVCITARRRGAPSRKTRLLVNTHQITTGAAFRAEAQRRGVTPPALARMILAVVAQDNMFAAVLDDGV